MPWVDAFAAFVVCHLVGDYLLSHVATYTLAFVPVLVWLADEIGAWAVGVAALIAIPHLIQDDGRVLAAYMVRVKHADPRLNPGVASAADQTFHLLALFLTALLVGD
jgi:hypothetical protein